MTSKQVSKSEVTSVKFILPMSVTSDRPGNPMHSKGYQAGRYIVGGDALWLEKSRLASYGKADGNNYYVVTSDPAYVARLTRAAESGVIETTKGKFKVPGIKALSAAPKKEKASKAAQEIIPPPTAGEVLA